MGKVYVVGIGPGNKENMTKRALKAIEDSEVVVGYSKYIDCILPLVEGKQVVSSFMRQEKERCEFCLLEAEKGKTVSLISSGDSGVYGMAGLILELKSQKGIETEIEIVPGVTSALSCAALLGAPIGHDFAVISFSDLLTPWTVIEKRIHMAAQGDFVLCIYNPKSKGRSQYLSIAKDILLQYRKKETPVGIVRNAGREGEEILLTALGDMDCEKVDMFCTVIVGSSQSYCSMGKMITPRGYKL